MCTSPSNCLSQREIALLDLVETPIFVIELNAAGDPVYTVFNEFSCRTLKLEKEEVIGLTAREFHLGRLGELAFSRHMDTFEGAASMSYETHLPVESGTRHIKTQLRPLLDDEGKVSAVVGTSRELTAEHALRALQLDTQVLDSEMEQFVNLAAHDLRAPMRNVNVLASMLKEGFEDQGNGKLEIINRLEEVATSTLSLIGDVLKHADSSRSQYDQSPTEFSLDTLFQEILSALDPMEQQRAQSVDCHLLGDRTVTQIVLRNLIDNAIKHNVGTGLKLSLTTNTDGVKDGFYQLRLTDSGSGFPDPNTAFLEGERENVASGGYGLLGIKRLIKTRGGTIRASNQGSGGAVVNFTLPGQLLDAASAHPAVEETAPFPSTQVSRKVS